MRFNMTNGNYAEGTVTEITEFVSRMNMSKPVAKTEKVKVVGKLPHRRNYRRHPWTGEELAKVQETIGLPVDAAMRALPTRNRASLWNIRSVMRKNALNSKLQAKLNKALGL
jgi:hypothetical protein